jgi:Flp pilus assembly protein CpaB
MHERTIRPTATVCGIGGIVCLMAGACLAPGSSEDSVTRPEVRALLYAVRDIPAGTLLTNPEALFKPRSPAEGMEPQEGIRDYRQLKSKVLTSMVPRGRACTPGQLLALPRGTRPLTVELHVGGLNGGFITTNSRCDVVCTIRTEDGPRSHLVAHGLLLLAIEPIADGLGLSYRGTFAVMAEEAKMLKQARTAGDLCPVLCASDDGPDQ